MITPVTKDVEPVLKFQGRLRAFKFLAPMPTSRSFWNRCQAKFLTCEVSDFTPSAHAQSSLIFHISNTLTKLMIMAWGVYVSVLG